MKNSVKIALNDKIVKFSFEEFDKEIDVDKLIKIDYSNLVAELITFPVVVNKLGLLVSDAAAEFRLAKLNLKITESKLRRSVREELTEADANGKVSKPTVQEIEDAMQVKKLFRERSEAVVETEKIKDYLESLYDASKDKSLKLNRLSITLQVGDVDEALVEKQINNIYYKIKEARN